MNDVPAHSHAPLVANIYAVNVVTWALAQHKAFLFRYKDSQYEDNINMLV